MIKSVHRGRCRRLMSIKVLVVTAPNLQRPNGHAALGLPLPRPTRCLTPALAVAPARLMSAMSSQVYSARHHCRYDVPVRIRLLPGCPGCRGMRRYAVVGGEFPPLSKYCTSREAVFVCFGHLRSLSEQRFSAARRLISKLRSRLDPDRVDMIIFLFKNL